MRIRSLIITSLLSLVVFGADSLVAAPCTDLGLGLFSGSFSVTHTSASTKKALSGLSFQAIATDKERTLGLRKNETMSTYETYAVSGYQLALDTDPKAADMIKRFDRASLVSFSMSPDLCFLLWSSSTVADLVDVNTILGRYIAGNIRLGSNNKLDGSEHMVFTRQ